MHRPPAYEPPAVTRDRPDVNCPVCRVQLRSRPWRPGVGHRPHWATPQVLFPIRAPSVPFGAHAAGSRENVALPLERSPKHGMDSVPVRFHRVARILARIEGRGLVHASYESLDRLAGNRGLLAERQMVPGAPEQDLRLYPIRFHAATGRFESRLTRLLAQSPQHLRRFPLESLDAV